MGEAKCLSMALPKQANMLAGSYRSMVVGPAGLQLPWLLNELPAATGPAGAAWENHLKSPLIKIKPWFSLA